jgi:hypothetical protein
VFLYSRYFNAVGENRYTPDGTFKDVLDRLRGDFEVRADAKPFTEESLRGVKVVLIANPSDKASGTNPAPPHVSSADIAILSAFVRAGGGLIVMENQENHNLEVEDMNKLLLKFGLRATNLYTDAKKIVVPKSAPIIGGLRWAYYTGNSLVLEKDHPARPRAIVENDLAQKPQAGPRDAAGVLMAGAELGRGRVVVATDSGWIADFALDETGVSGVALKGQDNWEIFRRLARWAAHAE